jgi:hypothetical protein
MNQFYEDLILEDKLIANSEFGQMFEPLIQDNIFTQFFS